jgi:hypothetical protein
MIKLVKYIILLIISSNAIAFDLATQISKSDGTVKVESLSGTKLKLIKESVLLKGNIVANGTATINGKVNIIMWVKVGNKYYFTKLPSLQNITDENKLKFQIPFNAGSKSISEVLIEIEFASDGKVSISDFSVENG